MLLLEAALRYQAMGLNVVPLHSVGADGLCTCGSPRCGKPGKHPRVKWRSLQDAPMTRGQIEQFWHDRPDSNIGIITGEASDLAVLDIDGAKGLESLANAGLPVDELPVAPTVVSGGGGLHLYYRMSESARTRGKALPGVDVRAEGGLVVAPPSMHSSGRPYRWQEGRSLEDLDPADFDFGLLSAPPSKRRRRAPWYEQMLVGVGEGVRNDAAARLAGRYVGLGLSEAETTLILQAWNLRNEPPLPESEIKQVVASIARRDQTDAESTLRRVSQILKLELLGVRRISGDSPRYILDFAEGEVRLSGEQLLSPRGFQLAVMQGTNQLIRKFGERTSPTHQRLASMVLSLAEQVDAGEEATEFGELFMLVQDLLTSAATLPQLADGSVPDRGMFVSDGRAWFSLPDLTQRAAQRWGSRRPIAATAQTLKAMGLERRTFDVTAETKRTMWGVPLSRVPFIRVEAESERV